jgi:hypothetical protein
MGQHKRKSCSCLAKFETARKTPKISSDSKTQFSHKTYNLSSLPVRYGMLLFSNLQFFHDLAPYDLASSVSISPTTAGSVVEIFGSGSAALCSSVVKLLP